MARWSALRRRRPGLAGHSDGDAVCHALADALLGAAALGDVGAHFPDTDPAVAGITGVELLGRSVALVRGDRARGGVVRRDGALRASGVAPRREEMRATLAAVLGIDPWARCRSRRPGPEGLGLSGDGVGCFAVATLR